MNNPEFSDVRFRVDGHLVHAHRAILVQRCHHFRCVFWLLLWGTRAVVCVCVWMGGWVNGWMGGWQAFQMRRIKRPSFRGRRGPRAVGPGAHTCARAACVPSPLLPLPPIPRRRCSCPRPLLSRSPSRPSPPRPATVFRVARADGVGCGAGKGRCGGKIEAVARGLGPGEKGDGAGLVRAWGPPRPPAENPWAAFTPPPR